ncbi:hypothetical protein, partial [uncultured Cellulomonas sp.]|uniref:hypothetical protein n=1 Tax=uncultured Cellulomonas sp. TaxID=189682 RepID=UPI0028EB6966
GWNAPAGGAWYAGADGAWYGGGPGAAVGATVLCDGMGENIAVTAGPVGGTGAPACGPTGR